MILFLQDFLVDRASTKLLLLKGHKSVNINFKKTIFILENIIKNSHILSTLYHKDTEQNKHIKRLAKTRIRIEISSLFFYNCLNIFYSQWLNGKS